MLEGSQGSRSQPGVAGTTSKLLLPRKPNRLLYPNLLQGWHPQPHLCPHPVLLWARALGLRGAGVQRVTLKPSSCWKWHTRPDLLQAVQQTARYRRVQGRSGSWTEGPWPNAGPSSRWHQMLTGLRPRPDACDPHLPGATGRRMCTQCHLAGALMPKPGGSDTPGIPRAEAEGSGPPRPALGGTIATQSPLPDLGTVPRRKRQVICN